MFKCTWKIQEKYQNESEINQMNCALCESSCLPSVLVYDRRPEQMRTMNLFENSHHSTIFIRLSSWMWARSWWTSDWTRPDLREQQHKRDAASLLPCTIAWCCNVHVHCPRWTGTYRLGQENGFESINQECIWLRASSALRTEQCGRRVVCRASGTILPGACDIT